MNRNIENVSFFFETMPLYQRIETNTADKLVRHIQDNAGSEKLDEELEILLDRMELENFICETQGVSMDDKLTKSQLETAQENILETYFLEKDRYERYYKPFSKSREDFEEKIVKLVKIEGSDKKVADVVNDLLKSLSQQREVINAQAKGRERFSFIKYNRELISRAKKIHETLVANGIKLNKEVTLEGVLTKTAKEVLDVYKDEIEDIDYLSPEDQIVYIAEQIKFNAVSFNNIKGDLEDDTPRTTKLRGKNSVSEVKKLPPLSASVNAGTDFEKRISMRFRDVLLEAGQSRKSTSRKVRTAGQKKALARELSENDLFKKDLRDIIVEILEISGVDVNSSTKSLFLNPHEVMNGNFALDQDLVKSFLNVTISTGDDNLSVLKVIANLEAMEGDEVFSVINSLPKRTMRDLEKKIKSPKHTEKEKEDFRKNWRDINLVQEHFVAFKEKYAEYINSFIEEEFLKILNYSIHVYKEDKAISDRPGVPVNVREKYAYINSETTFQSVEEVVEMIEILSFLKKDERHMSSKFTGLTSSQIDEVGVVIKNFAVKSFASMSDTTVEKILETREKILSNVKEAREKTLKKKSQTSKRKQ